ncbi:hypothetical protein E4U42_001859 [Claviceps africana]|uniref:Aminoglycoside phosphotransferase domain-containing protein n=1 Tax=Claviceps africana TaxID=83212 RepID=A0A8K0NL44_9HYPO|nr:hypothetical protein E4U42_001859 [Claviceps africana]
MSDAARDNPKAIAKEMLAWIDLELISCIELQNLWAGYGHVCAIRARRFGESRGTDPRLDPQSEDIRLILKIVSPPAGLEEEGHLRKLLSYEVEQFFYDRIAPTLGDLPLAKCLASTSNMLDKAAEAGLNGIRATLLTDLRLRYPVVGGRRGFLNSHQVRSAFRWLAAFHRSYWMGPQLRHSSLILPPLAEAEWRRSRENEERAGIWLNGGYTYLATRQNEYESLTKDPSSEWSALLCQPVPHFPTTVAEAAARFLAPRGRSIETYLHGDVKSENMYSTSSGDEVVFFDFQYVGLGLGVCDLAKFFTCSVPLEMLVDSRQIPSHLAMSEREKALLSSYREHLLRDTEGGSAPTYEWEDFRRHWETALVDWCRFQASWGFWGNTEWLQARVRCILQDTQWQAWLARES